MNYFKLKQYFVESLSSIYEEPELESIFFLLLDELYSISRIDYSLNKQKEVDFEIENKLKQNIIELKQNKPVQHILGYGYCLGRKFKVSKDVLIPRRETEELIDLILKNHKNQEQRIIDIGTGTACISINLKLESPQFEVLALDVSENVLAIAQENARHFKSLIHFQQMNILESKEWNVFENNTFDIIVSNPPYVRNKEKGEMHKNVLDYDPELALFVDDNNPLVFYTRILQFAGKKLRKGGFLYFEINEAFANEIVDLMKSFLFVDIQIVNDLYGKQRFVYGKKSKKGSFDLV